MSGSRIEKDSMGEVALPDEAYWGAQTARAIANFPVSGITFPFTFIRALALIKQACAMVNGESRALEAAASDAIIQACREIIDKKFEGQFPLDIFQTGSGTSTNMNVNEVIATRANELLTGARHTTHPVHPNDHVNMGQSSNDVIPSAIHVAACLEAQEQLLPALGQLEEALREKQEGLKALVKTGRTHLMDAVPLTFGQEISGWASQVHHASERIRQALTRLQHLALGGTAVGTGVNAKADFGGRVAEKLSELTGIDFSEAPNHFEAQSGMDAACAFSGSLRVYATGLLKISNDLRLMNSGPFSGMGEIRLASLQPGSSIMPGKVNPVIPEAARMVCVNVMASDAAVGMANAMGEFQLNVMLPLIAHHLLQSVATLASVTRLMAEKTIRPFEVDEEHIRTVLGKNPIIATALNPVIGYDKAAAVVKKALAEDTTVRQAAVALGYLSEEEAARLLDPLKMTRPDA